MDQYPINVRIEIGPGTSSDLSPMQSPDAWKALLKAMAKLLSMDDIPLPKQSDTTASHGLSTVSLLLINSHQDSGVDEYEFLAGLVQSEPGNN
jgi:hypothetical protein